MTIFTSHFRRRRQELGLLKFLSSSWLYKSYNLENDKLSCTVQEFWQSSLTDFTFSTHWLHTVRSESRSRIYSENCHNSMPNFENSVIHTFSELKRGSAGAQSLGQAKTKTRNVSICMSYPERHSKYAADSPSYWIKNALPKECRPRAVYACTL